jgi:hypothetical protein
MRFNFQSRQAESTLVIRPRVTLDYPSSVTAK